MLSDLGQGPERRRGKGQAQSVDAPTVIASVAHLASAARKPDSGGVEDHARFDRLTKRHRECLRGVRDLKGSKEIAEELGIEKSTVDSYLTEAVRLLGARNRRDAALRWAEYEARVAIVSPLSDTIIADDPAPDKIGGHSARLSAAPADLPLPVVPDESIVGAPGDTGEAPFRPSSPGTRLPFRRKGRRVNDLTVGDRLIWIQAIALGIAIGFGMLMTGLQVLTGLIEAATQRLS